MGSFAACALHGLHPQQRREPPGCEVLSCSTQGLCSLIRSPVSEGSQVAAITVLLVGGWVAASICCLARLCASERWRASAAEEHSELLRKRESARQPRLSTACLHSLLILLAAHLVVLVGWHRPATQYAVRQLQQSCTARSWIDRALDGGALGSPASSTAANVTLVILLGSLRGGERTWESLYAQLFTQPRGAPRVDLALSIGTSSNTSRSSLLRVAKYVWWTEEVTDWGVHLDALAGDHGRWRHELLSGCASAAKRAANVAAGNWICEAVNGVFGGVSMPDGTTLPGSASINYVLRWKARIQYEALRLDRVYSRVVISRTDIMYACPVELDLFSPGAVWIPDGDDYGGLYDRWMVCSGPYVRRCLSIGEPLFTHPRKYRLSLRRRGMSPEAVMRLRVKEMGIPVRRYARSLFVAAAPGDSSRWSRGHNITAVWRRFGVLAKYPSEVFMMQPCCAGVVGQVPE